MELESCSAGDTELRQVQETLHAMFRSLKERGNGMVKLAIQKDTLEKNMEAPILDQKQSASILYWRKTREKVDMKYRLLRLRKRAREFFSLKGNKFKNPLN